MNKKQNFQIDAINSLQEWLNSNAALPVLRGIAKSVLGWAKGDNLVHEILGIEKDDPDPELSVAAYVLEFLFDETRLKECRIQLAEYLETKNWNGFRSTLTSRIINFCKDKRREEASSPFHFHYRRMSQALSADKGTRYTYSKETGAYYAVSEASTLPFLEEGILSADDFRGWPEPGFSLTELNSAKVRVAVSRTFWNRALVELDREHFLPVIDLVRYMDNAYNFSRLMRLEDRGPIDDDNQIGLPNAERLHNWQPHDASNTLAGQQPVAEQNLLNQDLEKAAIRLAQSWSSEMQISFYLHLVCELTLKETARRVGLNSPQAVSHHVKKVEASLREFFMQWRVDGYTGEKPSHDEQKLVLGTLIDFILKNHPECRDEE